MAVWLGDGARSKAARGQSTGIQGCAASEAATGLTAAVRDCSRSHPPSFSKTPHSLILARLPDRWSLSGFACCFPHLFRGSRQCMADLGVERAGTPSPTARQLCFRNQC